MQVMNCYEPEEGEVLGCECDDPNCVYQWFHIKCLKLRVPAKYWYCPDLQKTD